MGSQAIEYVLVARYVLIQHTHTHTHKHTPVHKHAHTCIMHTPVCPTLPCMSNYLRCHVHRLTLRCSREVINL
jgi:hypothetical protein